MVLVVPDRPPWGINRDTIELVYGYGLSYCMYYYGFQLINQLKSRFFLEEHLPKLHRAKHKSYQSVFHPSQQFQEKDCCVIP